MKMNLKKSEIEVARLREQLKAHFDAVTAANAKAEHADEPIVLDEQRVKCFDDLWRTTLSLIRENLKKDAVLSKPNKSFLMALEMMLGFRLYYDFEACEMREGITDAEILAHAAAIRKRDLAALADLREEGLRTCRFKVDELYRKFAYLYRNVVNLLLLYAHKAKDMGSREGARAFLRAASQLQRCTQTSERQCIRFSPEQIDTIMDNFRAGLDELQLQLDYNSLLPWPEYRKRKQAELNRCDQRAAVAEGAK